MDKDASGEQRWELISPQATPQRQAQEAILRSLRQMTRDPSLTLLEVTSGEQDRWLFCGSVEGYRRIYTLFTSQQLERLLELPIQRIGRVRQEALVPEVDPQRLIHQHLQEYTQTHDPEDVLQHLRRVFVETHTELVPELHHAISRLVMRKDAEAVFPSFFLACFYRIIDLWQLDLQLRPYIPQLLGVLEHLPTVGFRQARATRRLRELVLAFPVTEHYVCLHRLCQLFERHQADPDAPLEQLLYRYPCLYKALLLPAGNTAELAYTVSYRYEHQQDDYEFRLGRFVMYQARLSQIAKARQLTQGAGRVLRRETNPTLLSDRELAVALRYFWGSLQGQQTQPMRAERLRTNLNKLESYARFKEQLHTYLVGQSQTSEEHPMSNFAERLKEQLSAILAHHDQHRPNASLSLRTTTKLLNFLILENAQNCDHYALIELVSQLGASFTIGLFWKLILLCPPLLSEVEKRLAFLFNHYAQFPQQEVRWLIQLLENHQLATSVYTGHLDLSPLSAVLGGNKKAPADAAADQA
jgi:hypothetical protein